MKFTRTAYILCLFVCLAAVTAGGAEGTDWPMWRYDAGRTACSPHELPGELHLLWVRQYMPRTPVWDDPLNQDIMPYDRIFEPVVLDGTLFVGFNDTDKVVAIDTDTGKELWTFYADGPVRLPPVAWEGKVYATSDDGHLYCLDAHKGTLVWKHRGGPSNRTLLGNKRLISMWPARGGAVVDNGVVYYAASIWPFMGTFIYALDAATGRVMWVNDGNGSEFMLQPHNAPSFAGVAPQGAFVLAGERLLIPGGRSVPAVFDRTTGKFLYYQLASSGKTGGSFVCARGDVFFNHYREKVTTMYHLKSGNTIVRNVGRYPVLAENTWYFSGDAISAYRSGWLESGIEEWLAGGSIKLSDLIDKATERCRREKLWEFAVDASGDLIQAGNRLYAAGGGVITAVDLAGNASSTAGVNREQAKPRIAWAKTVDGTIERLIAADGKLFAVTLDGRIMAFGGRRTEPKNILDRPVVSEYSSEITRRAREIFGQTGVTEGYALFYGIGDGALLEALVNNSKLHVIAVDPDGKTVQNMKRRFDKNGLYGSRVSVHTGDIGSFPVPQYMASLTIINDPAMIRGGLDRGTLDKLFSAMRPYGGVARLSLDEGAGRRFESLVAESGLHGAVTERGDGCVLLRREGPLPGAGVWTHNYGNIANTAKSDDDRVRLPLGILWFGGNSNLDVLPRHGHGPTEQVVGGRLFIEGMDCLSARDVYTGRVIWKTMLHDLDTYDIYYNVTYKDTPTSTRYNQVHLPGANIRGTNFIATPDRVYVLQGRACVMLDTATGKQLKNFSLPPLVVDGKETASPEWGYIGVHGDLLIGGYGFTAFSDLLGKKKNEYSIWQDFDASASNGLVAMDRYSGDVVWKIDAMHGFLHNGIAAGSGRLFCLDKLPPFIENRLARRGVTPTDGNRLIAVDITSGEIAWEKADSVFGSFLSYSEEYDMLIQSTRPSRDTVQGEDGKRIITYRGSDGSVIWDRPLSYRTFPIIHGANIVTEGSVFSLETGDQAYRTNPVTGKPVPWTWKRNYGCNYPIASEHLLTFRSGAAGFFDIANLGGTGNFGGFKSGCSISLVAADGVLNAPDYTRTCSCSYQNQTSLAMVHMPDADVEVWTFDTITWDGDQVKRAGINFGAPGDRLADDGTLWLDYPSVGGESPDIPVAMQPEKPDWYRFHSSRMDTDDYAWVAASGGTGLGRITVTLSKERMEETPYTVRMYFAEPDGAAPGKRVFDVAVQGKQRLGKFDIAKEAGGPNKLVVKEFRHVPVTGELLVELTTPLSSYPPVLSGLEIIAE